MDSNTPRPVPAARTGSGVLDFLSNVSMRLVQLERRFDPLLRPVFDATLRDPVARLITGLINRRRTRDGLGLAQEQLLPDEAQLIDSVIQTFQQQMTGLWRPGGFERGGNTKTHGIVRGELIVHEGLPERLRRGVFAKPEMYWA
jgi:hypothetical protein